MEISPGRAGSAGSERRTSTFTGEVWAAPVIPPRDELTINTVNFAPGARTYWHSHQDGQVLQVLAGEGRIATRGSAPQVLRPGDTVWAPPGEEHWHGAADGMFLVHTAISLGPVHWLEEVTDDLASSE
jgi:quercetin dioxygenase-like cupin family protein